MQFSVTRPVLFCLALVLAGIVSAKAERLHWASSLGAANTTSTGQAMDGGFYFELGVFKNGFVPTAANTADWAANWAPAQRVKYHGTNRWFSAVFTVKDNTAPFTAGAAAYVWGFKGSELQGEWILFRKSTWIWPAADPTKAIAFDWTAKDADLVVVGSVEPAGDKVNLRAAAVAGSLPPTTGWKQWREMELDGKTPLTGPNDDADGDGVSNVLEFAFGTSPLNKADFPDMSDWFNIAEDNGKRHLEMRVPRRRDRPVNFTAEVSNDLVNWTSGTTVTSVVSDSADAITLRDRTPISEAGIQRFMRVNATPQ